MKFCRAILSKLLNISLNYQYMVLLLFMLFVYHNIFLTYGFSDDYAILWDAKFSEQFTLMIQGGRLFYALLAKFLFATAYSVENLRYIRIIGLLGAWGVSVILFQYMLWLKWDKVIALLISFLIIVTPSFALYISWAATCLAPWAFLFSALSSILLIKYLNSHSLVLRIMIVFLSIILMECSLFIYQPSATAFLIPLILYVIAKPMMPIKQITVLTSVFLFSFVLYLYLFKLSLTILGLPKLDRATLNPHFIMDGLRFFYKDLKQILRLNFIFVNKTMRHILTATGYVALIFFIYRRGWKTHAKKMPYVSLFFLVLALPLTNLPRIASSEISTCYRSFSVTSVFVVIADCCIMNSRIINRIAVSLLFLSMTFTCYNNINNKHIKLQVEEYKLVYNEMKKVIKLNPKEVVIIRPDKHSLTSDVYKDEYGFTSNRAQWVSAPFFGLVVEKEIGTLSSQIKLQIYDYNQYEEKQENSIPVINIGKVLESSILKN